MAMIARPALTGVIMPADTTFEYDHLANDSASLKRALANKLIYSIGKDPHSAQGHDWLQAATLAVRDRLVERWMATTRAQYAQDVKRVYYLSMEFLIGRTFSNAVLALDLHAPLQQALQELGLDIELLAELEPDAALGNGGLGRLAACFLDSMATLGLAGFGYGIRYDYGMFKQQIIDGRQVESPDYWLAQGNGWEFPRPEVHYPVHFGGRVASSDDCGNALNNTSANTSANPTDSVGLWLETEVVQAVAYDYIIPGYGTTATNTLRLWSARASEEINLSAFNEGNYFSAVEQKNHSENVSRVLYPDDSTLSGRELRLRQEYFFCSASMQDLLRRYLSTHDNFDQLANKVAIHLNDTHPTLAIPELLRLLQDEHGLPWPRAWALTQQVFSYTNHTLMQEALETWPLPMIARVLPRHLAIIYQINAEFLAMVRSRFADEALVARVSLIDEQGERRVRMAFMAVVASHSINGVSQLHSDLMVQSIFADFARIFPERFNNKTNGITPRRWLAQANPLLAACIDRQIGRDWRRDLQQLARLKALAGDAPFLREFAAAKLGNKQRLAQWLQQHMHITVDPASLFDVQVKRIHEYKRQLLNILYVISRANRMLAQPELDWVPRTVIIAGKAASAYRMAKDIIKLANDVSSMLRNDARLQNRLQLVFIPNYSVSLAEIIIPAADLSQQISTAGTEASGTGNMKLSLNGALTIGTLDGANVEMREHAAAENFFIFGNTSDQVEQLRRQGYRPRDYYERNLDLKLALDQIQSVHFSPGQPGRFDALVSGLLDHGDHYQLLADFDSYCRVQMEVDALYRQSDAWQRTALANVAGMGWFSSDRTIAEYAEQIWHAQPVRLT
jgi:starch phosphorylase